MDFSPSATGKVGQIVRFLHDPDEMVVIADSFDDYLKMLMKNSYCFVDEMNFEE
ncbi:SMI1/KNR4 family protein [Capnocytophaga sputigena]|uniref:SMI1/KNR4 family protein n=1 Tax=Capnocytophaga sputigena TaxID=1019 RepID=UPI0028EF5C77|nr:SMI1/KNR4 family protein [Capnocytophaga sputigena]